MKSYTLNFAGGEVTEIHARNDGDAIRQATERLGDVVVADQWDADGANDDNEPCKRILFWADEAAENDGAHSIAQLETVGNA